MTADELLSRLDTTFGLIASFITILAAVTAAILWLEKKTTAKQRIIVRSRDWIPGDVEDKFEIEFSIINSSEEAVFVNKLSYGGTDDQCSISLSKISRP